MPYGTPYSDSVRMQRHYQIYGNTNIPSRRGLSNSLSLGTIPSLCIGGVIGFIAAYAFYRPASFRRQVSRTYHGLRGKK